MLNQHSDTLKIQHKNFNKEHKYKMFFLCTHMGFLLNVKCKVTTFDLYDNANATRKRFISNAFCITITSTNRCLYQSI